MNPNFTPTGDAHYALLDALFDFGYRQFTDDGDTIPGEIWEQWSADEKSAFSDGVIEAEADSREEMDDDSYDEYDDGQPTEMEEWLDFDPDC